MQNSVIPVVVVIDPTNPAPGGNVSVTIPVNPQPTENVTIAISGSPSGFFSSLPSEVVVQAFQSQAQFSATLATSASGTGTITATCNGTSKSADCTAT